MSRAFAEEVKFLTEESILAIPIYFEKFVILVLATDKETRAYIILYPSIG